MALTPGKGVRVHLSLPSLLLFPCFQIQINPSIPDSLTIKALTTFIWVLFPLLRLRGGKEEFWTNNHGICGRG
jgi:hypothetical protein